MKQFIKCPECGSVEIGTIDTSTFPYNTFIHHCSKCKYIIMESEWEPLKALSIKQPWAWLIVNGVKDIENRNWKTNFRGQVLIHASKSFDKKGYDFIRKAFTESGRLKELPLPDEFKKWTGGIVGYAKITGCVFESKSPWFFGKYGFELKDASITDIVPCKGKLSFFTPKID